MVLHAQHLTRCVAMRRRRTALRAWRPSTADWCTRLSRSLERRGCWCCGRASCRACCAFRPARPSRGRPPTSWLGSTSAAVRRDLAGTQLGRGKRGGSARGTRRRACNGAVSYSPGNSQARNVHGAARRSNASAPLATPACPSRTESQSPAHAAVAAHMNSFTGFFSALSCLFCAAERRACEHQHRVRN